MPAPTPRREEVRLWSWVMTYNRGEEISMGGKERWIGR
jgi:hypothetical protein